MLVLSSANDPSLFLTSHPHPEPKVPIAVAENFSLKLAKDPKDLLIASANAPEGSPPPLGERQCQ